jgi:hypothetical protein
MMGTRTRLLVATALMMVFVAPLCAYHVVLKNGQIIEFQWYRTTDNTLLYVDEGGKEISIPLASVDVDRTRELNTKENSPLDLPRLNVPDKPQTRTDSPSLGELARQRRPRDAKATTKQVWTSDDFPSPTEREAPVPTRAEEASTSETLLKFRLLGKEELGAAVLKRANAPNVDFPDRKNWEQRLFEAKKRVVGSSRSHGGPQRFQ